jgi:agmatine deiminase
MHPIVYRFTCLMLLLGGTGMLQAQTEDDYLPRYATPEELSRMRDTPSAIPENATHTPPAVPVRTMAEWEELQAIAIAWRSHPSILTEIVRAAQTECRVVVCCDNNSVLQSARNTLHSAGVDTTLNVDVVIAPNNSIWIRDYGPNSVYARDVDSLYFVDWRYNRSTRRKDDTIATTLAPFFGVPLFTTSIAPNDLVHTGGNFMADGMGTGFASDLILEENLAGNPYGASPKTRTQIEQILGQYMGIDRLVLMTKLPYDVIHHIDMHMKLLDEQTLLVGEYPPGISDGPQIEANIQYVLSQYNSAFGTPFRVVRIPMPPGPLGTYPINGGDYRTYTNSILVNKTVLVPFYAPQYDTTALRIWQEIKPGYRIVGINCNEIIPSLGAIHCITKEVGVADPIRIVHRPIEDIPFDPMGYLVQATIQHRSGIGAARVWYTTDTAGVWSYADLYPSPLDTLPDVFFGRIPVSPGDIDRKMYYYIEAEANNGKTITRPLSAPKGWWCFRVQPLTTSAVTPVRPEMMPVFPNPARAITCVPVVCNGQTSGRLVLVDAMGREVLRLHEGPLQAGINRFFFDAALHPSGVYWLWLLTPEGATSQQVLVHGLR